MKKLANNIALIVVDAQNDFMPGGNLAVAQGNDIVPVINDVRDAFNTVVFTKDFHPKHHVSFTTWPEHCVQGTVGAELHKDLIVRDEDLIINKGTNLNVDSYSAFFENDGKAQPKFANGKTFEEEMKAKGIDTLVFTGLAGDYCVAWNMEDALKAKFKVVAIKEAIKSIDDKAYTTTQEKLEAQGAKFVEVQDLQKLL